jgi:hypothetical protein
MTPLLAGLMVGAFGLGGLFLWLGFGRERSRGARRWAMAGIVVIVALSYVSQVASLYDGGLEPEVPQLLALAWNLLRWQLRGYGEALVLAVGAFAWIVGAREARAAESVFD